MIGKYHKHRLLPIGVSDFALFTQSVAPYVYVDKSKYIADLLDEKLTVPFFYSRPRRFGKSLFVSMLASFFSSRREEFVETWIYKQEQYWPSRHLTVLRLDFSDIALISAQEQKEGLSHFEYALRSNLV